MKRASLNILTFLLLNLFAGNLLAAKTDSLFYYLQKSKTNKEKVDVLFKKLNSKKIDQTDRKKKLAILDSLIGTLTIQSDKAYALHKKGKIFFTKGDNKLALESFFAALKYYEILKDVEGQGNVHYDIGASFREIKNFKSAISHLYYSLQIAENLRERELISNDHATIGSIFKDEEIGDSSLFHHRIALNSRIALKNKKLIAASYNDIGLTYKMKKDFEMALEYLQKALKLREEIEDHRGVAGAYINIGHTYRKLKRYKEARDCYNKGMEISLAKNYPDFYINGLSGRAENALMMKDYKTSAEDYNRYSEIKDSVYKANMSAQLNELEISYQTDKKDAEIALQEEQIKSKSAQNSKQKMFTFASTIALLMALVAVFFVYRSYRQNKRNAIELATKNHLIEEKNREITDSINYAKLIQQSLLASKEMLDKNLESYFILYKPKDIVSGDFYWASETDKGFLVACVDCTGHGVPGAFMSLIGKENLDKALAKTTNPGEILHELNRNVKKSLNQNAANGSRDGMDAAIIRVDRTKNGKTEIVYAGANRPLYILKNDIGTIEEVKATKQAIGGFTPINQQFTEHTVQVEKGDTIVIATDGFADQFGSNNNKKLTTKRFKELLISIQSKNASEQKQNLEDFFTTWKGNYEQLDDLLVIGINI